MSRFRLLAAPFFALAILAVGSMSGLGQNSPPPKADSKGGSDAPKICFFAKEDYEGQSLCLGAGERKSKLGSMNDRIRSIKLRSGLQAVVCADPAFAGACETISSSRPDLSDLNDTISSLKVR